MLHDMCTRHTSVTPIPTTSTYSKHSLHKNFLMGLGLKSAQEKRQEYPVYANLLGQKWEYSKHVRLDLYTLTLHVVYFDKNKIIDVSQWVSESSRLALMRSGTLLIFKNELVPEDI